MTRHDPFSYGQVQLGADQNADAGTPDDLLFADAGPGKKAAPADPSWELLDADVSSLLPGAALNSTEVEFGTEILGEADAPAPGKKVPPAPARPATLPPPQLQPQPRAPFPAPAEARTAVTPAAAPRIAKHRPATHTLPPRPVRLSSTLVPAALFACGGTTAAWFYAMEQDVVMAGITGALSLVTAAFARVWLRA